jgi:hypothetical protein
MFAGIRVGGIVAALTVVQGLVVTPLWADDAYFRVPLRDLKLTEGTYPPIDSSASRRSTWPWLPFPFPIPYAVLDSEGEAIVDFGPESMPTWRQPFYSPDNGHLVVRSPKGRDVTGRLCYPKAAQSVQSPGMVMLRFAIPASAARSEAVDDFNRVKRRRYTQLLQQGGPGAAWFRHQLRTIPDPTGAKPDPRSEIPAVARRGQLERTYELFSGGRAVSENLQLDRALPAAKTAETHVDLATLRGISVREIDWKPLLKGEKPELDPLARFIPADQHAIFFPSFTAAAAMADQVQSNGLPIYAWSTTTSDAGVAERYSRQFGLSMSTLARLLGPHVARSVALTGSDPYFPMGTDVVVLFESPNPAVLESLLLAKIALGAAMEKGARPQHGQVDGLAYRGFCSPNRRVSVYVARLAGAVVASNSLPALGRVASVSAGRAPAVAGLEEYTFFRNRYRRGDAEETALVFVSDATIRRWCGPRWRIADSRRVRALAVLSELQAAQADSLVRGTPAAGAIYCDLAGPEMGALSVGPEGVRSATLGSLEFMTPIVELPITSVTTTEAEAYSRWRDNYQRNWRWAFDPIAVRVGVQEKRLSADLTVMPLIVASDYNELAAFSRGVQFDPARQDAHDSLVHGVLSFNRVSRRFAEAGSLLGAMGQGMTLGWVGKSVAVYADDDPFWGRLADSPEWQRREMPTSLSGLPVALRIDVTDGLQLALFLSSARAVVNQSAPGLTVWETRNYKNQAYVRISPSEQAKQMGGPVRELEGVYYATTGNALLVTLSEPLLRRAIDRQLARDTAKKAGKTVVEKTRPWLGENVALSVDARLLTVLNRLFPEMQQRATQWNAWQSLAILNEWKRLYPDQDPVAVHERLWKVKLVCPGGGRFVWNDRWRTMESTVYGCPGQPKQAAVLSPALAPFSSADFGLTFEDQGLRAQVRLERR